jgi:threonine dehydrogenase-like Zn-dependent dehydrogenase
MLATRWKAPNKVTVDEVPEPRILNRRDAIVRVTTSAICGSDLHLLDGYVPGMKPGDVLGHEFMGEVVETGPDLEGIQVGDRVVVAFPISCGRCWACRRGLYAACENSNPNAHLAEKLWGHSPAGVFGYSHVLGGFAGGQAEYVRVPFADVGALRVPDEVGDEQALFLGDILSTAYMGAEMAEVGPGDVVAIWGAGPVGLLAIACARMLGASRIIAIDRFAYRLRMALDGAGADEALNYEEVDVLEVLRERTGGRGPDKVIDAVGMEAHSPRLEYAVDRAKQAVRIETDRPFALREAIQAVRNGGIVSVIGVYGGFIDTFPMGAVVNRGLTIRAGQCHVQRYMARLLERIQAGELDPSFIITHRLRLEEAAEGYRVFKHKQDEAVKVVLRP